MLPFKGRIKVTSGYRTAKRPNHGGIDLVGLDSAEILAVGAGRVTEAAAQKNASASYGKLVIVTLECGARHYYAHLSSIAVKVGDIVNEGDILGVAGATGNATGIHLHFEARDASGKRTDPLPYLPALKNVCGVYCETQAYAQSPDVYIVRDGDTLSAIGEKYGVSWQKLAQINRLANPNLIFAGQRLIITETAPTEEYFDRCDYDGVSIVDALKSMSAPCSYSDRKRIASANGIDDYKGTAKQNLLLLSLLKEGRLKRD